MRQAQLVSTSRLTQFLLGQLIWRTYQKVSLQFLPSGCSKITLWNSYLDRKSATSL